MSVYAPEDLTEKHGRRPCMACGGVKPPGVGRRCCDQCRRAPRPCVVCGGPKPKGRGRRTCDSCSAPELQKLRRKPAENRARHLWLRYRITLADYDEMLSAQHGLCAICGSGSPEPYRNFDVDHDAKTGKVRGLLCRRCNTTLGLIENGFITEALTYLERHGSV